MTSARLLSVAALAAALAAGPALIADAAPRRPARPKPAATEPATPAAPAAEAAPAVPATPDKQIATSNPAATIPAVLQASGQFTTLLKAAQATNLTGVLGGPRQITVFAPTDQAFAALPPGALDALMAPDRAADLQKILTYHVVATKLPPVRGHAASAVPTAAGASVQVDGSGPAVMVGAATVLQSDVQASNGSIYVIDKVLLPPGMTLPAGAGAAATPSGG